MLGLIIALIVVGTCGYAIYKNYKSQTVLLVGGFVMMAFAIILGTGGPIIHKGMNRHEFFIERIPARTRIFGQY